MALVASIHVDQGWKLPDMAVTNTANEVASLQNFMGKNGLLIAFTCNHCPYAIAIWPRLIKHAARLRAQGVNTLAINPNIHPDFPADSAPVMQEKIIEWGIDFPYVCDNDQSVAQAFQAQCTPDLYLFDSQQALYYHGRMDDYWKDENKVQTQELLPAVDAMLASQPAPQPQHPTIGCSIKWLDAD